MERLLPYFLLLVAVVTAAVLLRGVSRRLRAKSDELQAFEGEEERMFDFLHVLGASIEAEATQLQLHRMIVDGVIRVVAARGGAIYVLGEDGETLLPKYLSEECPPLVAVPPEIRERAEHDPRALESYLRLTPVAVDGGLLGSALTADDTIRVDDLQSHESLRPAVPAGRGNRGSALLAPLHHGSQPLGVLAVTRDEVDGGFTRNDFAVFRSVAEQSAFALGNALLYREASEKRQFESELRNASEVQRVLLPQGEPQVPGYRVAGTNVPARIISGDYYDCLDLGDGCHGMVIADVSGKGVAAGLLMAMCRSVLRSHARGRIDPAEVLGHVNRQLFPDIREDMFITLFYGVIDGEGGRIRLARAGHDPALLFRAAEGNVESVKPPGLALGIDEGEVFERVTRVLEMDLASGDVLLFYTDGVKEAVDAAGEEFGMERLRAVFRESAPLGAEMAVATIQRELGQFVGDSPQMDDVTVLAMEKR